MDWCKPAILINKSFITAGSDFFFYVYCEVRVKGLDDIWRCEERKLFNQGEENTIFIRMVGVVDDM